jgi:hypothetical protein
MKISTSDLSSTVELQNGGAPMSVPARSPQFRIDQVTVVSSRNGETTSRTVTDDSSWFNGPPYAVAELVFNEFDMGGCTVEENDSETVVE